MLPPRWLRRITLGPLVLVLMFFAATTLPLSAMAAAFISPRIPGRWRPLRLLWFTLVFLAVESAGLLASFVLWVASGFGWKLRTPGFQAAHYQLMRWYVGIVIRTARRTFNLVVEVEDIERTAEAATEPVPFLVFSRHAGAGDSFLLVDGLLKIGRRPRIVLKETLQWAPCLDVVLNRIPAHFVSRGKGGDTEGIARLAADLGPQDALVIFPEGGNFSEGRRTKSIAKLEELGRHVQADQARQMRHVLAPRPGGALAAMSAAPTADVVFVAHTGLEDLSRLVDLWRGLPMDSHVSAKAWRVHAADIPPSEERRTDWLFSWWLWIDTWIINKRGEDVVPNAIVDAVAKERPEAPG